MCRGHILERLWAPLFGCTVDVAVNLEAERRALFTYLRRRTWDAHAKRVLFCLS